MPASPAAGAPPTSPGPSDQHRLDHDRVLRQHGYHRLTVKKVVTETADTRSYVLAVPDDLVDTFRYRPGQFCTFRVDVQGQAHLRSYSMSSAPATDADLAVTVKRVPGGVVSNWMNDRLCAGDTVEATRPAGVFCPQEDERPVVAFCGGSGITPVMSITKHVLATTGRTVRLLYANRDRHSVIFGDALARLGADHPDRFHLTLHLDADGGFVTADAVDRFADAEADADADADYYVCGPGPFMDLVESVLLRRGVDPGRIFIERFAVEGDGAPAPLPANSGAEVGDGPAAATPAAPATTEAPQSITIILGGTPHAVDYHLGDTVLATARRGGLRPPFSCEAGDCATCMAFLREGAVTMRANNALTDEEVAEGWILTCQSLPSGRAVTVEYEAF